MGKDSFHIASRTECNHLVPGVKNIVVGGSGDFLETEIKFVASFQKGFFLQPLGVYKNACLSVVAPHRD